MTYNKAVMVEAHAICKARGSNYASEFGVCLTEAHRRVKARNARVYSFADMSAARASRISARVARMKVAA